MKPYSLFKCEPGGPEAREMLEEAYSRQEKEIAHVAENEAAYTVNTIGFNNE